MTAMLETPVTQPPYHPPYGPSFQPSSPGIRPGASFTPRPARPPVPQAAVTMPLPAVPAEPEWTGTAPPALTWSGEAFMDPSGAYPVLVQYTRAFVAETLKEWGVGEEDPLSETAVLLISEIAGNAIRASDDPASPGMPLVDEDGHTASIAVGMKTDRRRILLQVWDEAPGIPKIGTPGLDDESGRGLMIIDAVSESYGCYRARMGKVFWAIVDSGPR